MCSHLVVVSAPSLGFSDRVVEAHEAALVQLLRPDGQVERGEPTTLIPACVRSMNADLVVLGHRRRSFLDRWWSGDSGGYIIDGVPCSLLIARDVITDAELERRIGEVSGGRLPL